jgi:hypothetical protein
MREQHTDTERPNPGNVDSREAKGALENQENGQRAENEKDVERNRITPSRPLKQNDDGQQDDGTLRKPF